MCVREDGRGREAWEDQYRQCWIVCGQAVDRQDNQCEVAWIIWRRSVVSRYKSESKLKSLMPLYLCFEIFVSCCVLYIWRNLFIMYSSLSCFFCCWLLMHVFDCWSLLLIVDVYCWVWPSVLYICPMCAKLSGWGVIISALHIVAGRFDHP